LVVDCVVLGLEDGKAGEADAGEVEGILGLDDGAGARGVDGVAEEGVGGGEGGAWARGTAVVEASALGAGDEVVVDDGGECLADVDGAVVGLVCGSLGEEEGAWPAVKREKVVDKAVARGLAADAVVDGP